MKTGDSDINPFEQQKKLEEWEEQLREAKEEFERARSKLRCELCGQHITECLCS